MTKSEKIKAKIEQVINQLKKDLVKSNHPLIDISVSERIATLEEVLGIINGIPDDEPQQLQPISVPFGQGVNNCAAKCCWEPGGVCSNPHRDCINCPKNWNLGFTTHVGTSIEGNISADPKDWHVIVKPKISEDTAWNVNIKGACKLDVAPEVKCGEVCDHCISQPICDKPEK